ncbi:hypothetical protein HS088_TW17G00758 [Tripterygium wilfordii]|uniref:Uncharacterized protein n=1 Tax=Tripterygium wilfordii TaxID=458696 RepID=A0A7J7CGP3_TRIWF|nr:uncharacterized protein LOC119982599 [Tripterygium wilfordii]KAF5733218.1 hypothetical protein HS088_TW17G00758 [Tripterygium wilfordii]
MSSMAQSVLMALTVTVNQFASSNLHAVQRREAKRPNPASVAASNTESGRRGVILSSVAAVLPVTDSRTQLLEKYLKKSQENKAKNDKERMDNYYKRNYKDYFEFVEGSLQGKDEQQLTESEKGILDWLKNNR